MPIEGLKEIVNATFDLGDAVGDSITLITTDATTQYVLRDVILDGTLLLGGSGPLRINNTDVASLTTSLSGSEIVDVSSTVTLGLPVNADDLIYFDVLYATSGTAVTGRRLISTLATLGTVALNEVITANTLLDSMPAAGSDFFEDSGDYWYINDDLNSTQTVYRLAGGLEGTRTQVLASSTYGAYTPFVYDADTSKVWFVESNDTIQSYNLATNSLDSSQSTTGDSFTGPLSNYPRLAYSNGRLFHIKNNAGQSNFLTVINVSTLVATTIASMEVSGLSTPTQTDGSMAMCLVHNATSDRYAYVYAATNTSEINIIQLDDAFVDGTTYTVTTGNTTIATTSGAANRKSSAQNSRIRPSEIIPGHFEYLGADDLLHIYDVDANLVASLDLIVDGDSLDNDNYFVVRALPLPALNTLPATADIRITGVEVTGV